MRRFFCAGGAGLPKMFFHMVQLSRQMISTLNFIPNENPSETRFTSITRHSYNENGL